MLPQETERFLEDLYDHLFNRDLIKATRLYEVSFPAIVDQHYGSSNLPPLEEVVQFYTHRGKEHYLIYVLYLELYHRHAFAHSIERVTWQMRIASWQNYKMFFKFLIGDCCAPDADESEAITLPAQWLWDMFDEFIFQFQDTQRRKWRLLHSISLGRGANRSTEESETLAELWDASAVTEFLYKFVKVSRINEHLRANKGTIKYSGSQPPINLLLGYFAAVSLLRVNNMVCDYGHALDCVKDLALDSTATSAIIPSCHTTLLYNVAFARFMSKDYSEAVKAASQVLYHATRNRQYFTAVSQHTREAMDAIIEKLYLLVVVCEFLAPQVRLDEFLMTKVREAHRDKLQKLQSDPEEAFFDIFKRVCPKFMSMAQFIQNMGPELVQMQQPSDILQRQANVFIKDIGHQRKTEQLLSFAKLYNNVSLSKLAALMNLDQNGDEVAVREQVRSELLSIRAMQKQSTNAAHAEFYVEEDSVHVTPHRAPDVFVDQYTKQNQRIEELLGVLRSIDLSARSNPSHPVVSAVAAE